MNTDVAKCHGEGCSVREDCLRYTSIPHPTRQSWFRPVSIHAHGCEHRIANARTLPPPKPGEDYRPYNVRWFDA